MLFLHLSKGLHSFSLCLLRLCFTLTDLHIWITLLPQGQVPLMMVNDLIMCSWIWCVNLCWNIFESIVIGLLFPVIFLQCPRIFIEYVSTCHLVKTNHGFLVYCWVSFHCGLNAFISFSTYLLQVSYYLTKCWSKAKYFTISIEISSSFED